MDLKLQKRLAAKVLKCSPQRIVFDTAKLATIKEALTRADIRDLINSNIIHAVPEKNTSRVRARHIQAQKSKGLRKGTGSRKGTAKARADEKYVWMNKVRTQRDFIKQLKDNGRIDNTLYRSLYDKVKGNFFRTRGHIKLYLEEHSLFLPKAGK
ncbi:MAG TPA: 50S ribosomal protein L19e [Acidobacteriota bacterium]|nr:50S ribosomal protein L19e [Acidobacteriota bacterium]